MPKFSVCGGESWTWPGKGMGTIPGCLFPSLWAIFADLTCIFPFLAETTGLPMPKFSVCGGEHWTWPGQGMDIILGWLFPFLWAIFSDLGLIFPFSAETPGLFMPKFSVYGRDRLTWPGQGMYIIL